ncbi:MAG: hypothetical protein EBU82_04135 [Flavobacteriia bacterium]|nr:hypothetical protein [Flavobacteriia bacterium]
MSIDLKNYVNKYRFFIGLVLLLVGTLTIQVNAQCPFPPTINSILQPTCYNNFGTVNLTGLPSGAWTLTATPTAGCPGATVNLSGTGTSASITGLTPGCGYEFAYIQASPVCTSGVSNTVNVNVVPSPPSTPNILAVNQPNCAPGVTTGCVSLGNLPLSGAWFITAVGPSGSIVTPNQLGSTYTMCGLGLGMWQFTVTRVIDSCVSAGASITMFAPTNPDTLNIFQVTQPSCAANFGSVTFNNLPSGMQWTINASPNQTLPSGGAFNGTGTTATFSNLTPGICYLFTVTDTNNCTSAFSPSVCINNALTIAPPPTAVVTQPTCPLPTGTIAFTGPIGAQYVYSINGTNFQSSTTFTNVPGGTYTLYVQETGSGCITPSVSTYVVNPTPQPPAISIPEVHNVTCFGSNDGWAVGQVDSLGTPPFVYSWSPVSIANDTATNLSPGTYNFVVVDALQCVVIQSVTISQPTAMAIMGDSTPINCATGQLGTMDVTVTGGSGPYTYLWSPNGQSTDSIFNLNIGNYSVVVTDTNGCQVSFSSSIGIINDLQAIISPGDTTINPGTFFTANVNVGTNFNWSPSQGLSCDDCPNPLVTPDTTTMYYVNVSDDNGCLGEDSMLVTVKLLCGEYFVPTIFSPNGTGPDANNTLRVFGKEVCIKDFSFVIYDRWGQKVFESVSINMAWDGFYKGRPAQEGNFVYDLNLQLYDDSIIRKSGSLTLVR